MQVKKETLSPTSIKLAVAVDADQLEAIKNAAVKRLGKDVRLQGFRAGKAPEHLIEKQLDQSVLQSEVMDQAINQYYIEAVQQENLRPVSQPQVNITKFVPFTTLEFSAEFDAIGEIKLPDYSKIKVSKAVVAVTAKDVDEVVANLRTRAAEKEDVKRASKLSDQVTIDFKGTDAKTHESISGADGDDYPLVLGSNSFIPGFEDNLVGLKAGEQKTFDLTFPKDYAAKPLQNRKITFTVTVSNVQQMTEPKLDDDFAAKVGPFKTVAELKADIKKQLQAEREQQAERDLENQLLEKIAAGTKVTIPDSLIEAELDRIEDEEKRNLVYRGQTWQEHLDEESVTAEQHREKNREGAALRVKAGLVLTEAAEREAITVDPAELDMQIQLMKGRYSDAAMQAELDKPENRRELASRLLSQKTIEKIKTYVTN